MQIRDLQRRRGLVLVCLIVFLTAVWAPPALGGEGKKQVYVQSNTAPFNTVLIFDQNHDGTLTPAGSVMTGGAGQPAGNPPLGIPFLDSAGSVTVSDNGRFVFVVNAGDDTVSSFRVTGHGLRLVDVEPSMGFRPISSTTDGHLLYVLNTDVGSASIAGFRIDAHGALTFIPGSVHNTSDPATGLPAQIQFDARGGVLAVTNRQPMTGPGIIDTFVVDHDGVAGPAVAHPSSDETPYGIAFTRDNRMAVSNEHFSNPFLSSTSSYTVSGDGDVTPVETELTNAGAACWNVITKDDRYVLVTNPITSNVSSFRLERDGHLTPVGGNSIVYTGTGNLLDEAFSHDGKYLYVLNTDATFTSSTIDEFRMNRDGTITLIGSTAPFGDGSSSGVGAW